MSSEAQVSTEPVVNVSPTDERPRSPLTTMRDRAKRLGLTGYSRLRMRDLAALLQEVVVYRQDRVLMKKLRARLGAEPWWVLRVAAWTRKGYGRHERYFPRAWFVPTCCLDGAAPLSKADADAILAKRSEAGRKGARRRHLAEYGFPDLESLIRADATDQHTPVAWAEPTEASSTRIP